ncbi:AAEL007737-PA [Aedes aegypti]|uniref:AAEL007737-PA n=1 Tax=Aedes aegypti TaxID=7159 RepID=Q171A4_AEDAE|nr:AAEL007737-PA [Aedes aegypti]
MCTEMLNDLPEGEAKQTDGRIHGSGPRSLVQLHQRRQSHCQKATPVPDTQFSSIRTKIALRCCSSEAAGRTSDDEWSAETEP